MPVPPDKPKQTRLKLLKRSGKSSAKTAPVGLKASEVKGTALTPLQLLGVILKAVLKERITDDEVASGYTQNRPYMVTSKPAI